MKRFGVQVDPSFWHWQTRTQSLTNFDWKSSDQILSCHQCATTPLNLQHFPAAPMQYGKPVIAPKRPCNTMILISTRCGVFSAVPGPSFLRIYSCYHLLKNFVCRPLRCMAFTSPTNALTMAVWDVEFPWIRHLPGSWSLKDDRKFWNSIQGLSA